MKKNHVLKLLRMTLHFYTALLVLFCITIPVSSSAQRISFNLKDIALSEFVQILQEKGYSVVLKTDDVDINRKITIFEEDVELKEIINKVLEKDGVSCKIEGRTISISKNVNAYNNSSPNQKTIKYSGVVKDEQGITIVGATVVIEGTTTGVTTDIDGVFSIESDATNLVLIVSFLGYTSEVVKVTATNPKVEVALTPKDILTDEVVIIGYGTQSKKTLTGAVSSVKIADVEMGAISTLSHALGGKMAGLRVNQTSAKPGGGSNFTIRGATSIGASNQPLFVIDGFPISVSAELGSGSINIQSTGGDNVLESLNPDDIESITILKDAASTSIYGARAGNGVILITTKRGKSGKPKITYSGSTSIQVSYDEYDMLNTADYMKTRNQQDRETFKIENGLDIYAEYKNQTGKTLEDFKPTYTDEQIANLRGTDWLDAVTRNGFMQQHNLSMSGGTESTRYLVSIGYMNQDGIVKNNGVERFSARVNLDQDVSDYVKVGITATYSQNKSDNMPLGTAQWEQAGVISAAIQALPTHPIYNEDGTYFINPNSPSNPNPVSLLEIQDYTIKDRILASGFVKISPIHGWEIKAQLGADRRFQKRSNYIPKTVVAGKSGNGIANIAQIDDSDYLLDITTNYGTTINDHSFKVLAGYSFQHFNSSSLNGGNKDFITDGFGFNNIGAGADRPTIGSSASKSSIASYFARANYNYKEKYLLELTVRADGTSNFSPENRWGYFPAISGAWLISEENFMKSSENWLSSLKLRSSYGQTGNSSVGYRIQDFYSVGNNAVIGGNLATGVYVSELGNKDITWETTTEFNIGLDLNFFNNRLKVVAEYYDRTIKDLLVASNPLPSYNEITSIAGNIGSTQSQGFEVTIDYIVARNKDFNWNTTLTLSTFKDRWLKREPNWKPYSYQKENDPIRAWWSYEALEMMQPGDKAPLAQPTLLPGQLVIKDQNEDGLINQDDMVYMDSGDPKIVFGWNNQFTYKNFDLGVSFYGEAGQKKGASYYESWTSSHTMNVSSFTPKLFSSENLDSNVPSGAAGDHYVKSIYYIRCGNITLGYKVPISTKILNNLKIQLGINNPFVITNWTGLDPETDNGAFAYPNVTSYNFGLNLTF